MWAFEKLADKSQGVIGISFRQVPCDYHPEHPAQEIANPSPPELPPPGTKRPDEQIYVKRFDSVGQPQNAVSAVNTSSQAKGKTIVPLSQIYQDGTFQQQHPHQSPASETLQIPLLFFPAASPSTENKIGRPSSGAVAPVSSVRISLKVPAATKPVVAPTRALSPSTYLSVTTAAPKTGKQPKTEPRIVVKVPPVAALGPAGMREGNKKKLLLLQ